MKYATITAIDNGYSVCIFKGDKMLFGFSTNGYAVKYDYMIAALKEMKLKKVQLVGRVAQLVNGVCLVESDLIADGFTVTTDR